MIKEYCIQKYALVYKWSIWLIWKVKIWSNCITNFINLEYAEYSFPLMFIFKSNFLLDQLFIICLFQIIWEEKFGDQYLEILHQFHTIIINYSVNKGERIGQIIMKKALIEKSGQPEHDSEYLRTKIEYNMMAMNPGESHEESIVIIENDLPRTFTTMKEYNQSTEEGKNNIESLRKILRAFTVMRPDVGYVQGMSYLAGFLFLDNTEYDTFVLFHNMVIKSQLLSFYKFKADEIIQRLKFFRQAFLNELPDLWEYFEEENIDPRSYIYEWVMTLYTRALPVNVVKRVWDLYFVDGFPLLFKWALAILKILKDQILYSDISEVMNTLKNTQNIIIDENQLLKVINEVQLPHWVYAELKDLQVQ